MKEILFGGIPKIPSEETFHKARKNNPFWYNLLEEALISFTKRPENVGIYADPQGKGATLEQCWLTYTLFGCEPYCFLAYPVPAEQIKRITKVVPSSPEQIIQTLKNIQSIEAQINVMILSYDGITGHCVRITSYDEKEDRFIYHDPWPERSLLCKDNNIAGVDAQQAGTRWSVTSNELRKVIYASFVLPPTYLKLQGIDFDIKYEIIKDSDFFKFFHLRKIDDFYENGINRKIFVAGSSKQTVIIEIVEGGKIVNVSLEMDREWFKNNIAMALEISRSFILTFVPVPDRKFYEEISCAIRNLEDPTYALKIKEIELNKSAITECLHALMGLIKMFDVTTDLCSLHIDNEIYLKRIIHKISLTLF